MNLRVYFEPTSLFDTLVMLVLLAGGIGLIARSLQGRRRRQPSQVGRVSPRSSSGTAYSFCWPLAWILTQVSLRVRVRLKTGRPGGESGSGQK